MTEMKTQTNGTKASDELATENISGAVAEEAAPPSAACADVAEKDALASALALEQAKELEEQLRRAEKKLPRMSVEQEYNIGNLKTVLAADAPEIWSGAAEIDSASPAADTSAIDQIDAKDVQQLRDSVITHVVQQIEQWPDRLRKRDAATLDEYRTRVSALKPGEFSPDDAEAIDAYVSEIIETQFVRMVEPPRRNEVRGAIAASIQRYGDGPVLPTELVGILHSILRLNAMLGIAAAIVSLGTSNNTEEMLEFESTALRVSVGGLLRCCEGWE